MIKAPLCMGGIERRLHAVTQLYYELRDVCRWMVYW